MVQLQLTIDSDNEELSMDMALLIGEEAKEIETQVADTLRGHIDQAMMIDPRFHDPRQEN